MDSTSNLDAAFINKDALDLTRTHEVDKATGKDDNIKGAEIKSIDYKITSEEQDYTILSESDIRQLQDIDINKVSSVLLISKGVACLLLIHHEWSVLKVYEAWFDDEESVRKVVGLLQQQEAHVGFPNSKSLICDICLNTVSCDKVRSAGCGHSYCILCWKQYMDTSIDEGPDKCLKLRCPQPSCKVAVGGDMINELASESKRNKYNQFLFRSYVENNKKMKWCPAPACEYAVIYEPAGFKINSDVTCLCYHSFCWKCGEEAHSPVNCETVKQWIMKNNSASENIAWILAHTKPCPKCKKPIEKIDGCAHMECKCGFKFCWQCLRNWANCKYSCLQFLDDGIYEAEMERKMENDYLEKCTKYYELWASNDLLRKNALEYLMNLRNAGHTKRLGMLYKRLETDFEFIEVAWKQVVECRRVLKWTCVYGYYLPRSEQAKKDYLEYIQCEAEAALEMLLHCAEEELSEFLYSDEPKDVFDDFRWKLMNLTRVTKTYFENLVKALENGLTDVHVKIYVEAKRGSNEKGESSNGKKKRSRNNI